MTIVAEQSAHLSRLVNAMFLLSRAEARGLPLVPEPVYIDDLVAEVGAGAARARARAGDHDRRARRDGRGVRRRRDAAASVDPESARQRRAARQRRRCGHGKSCSARPAGITIRVTDDGEGVPEAQRERIFDRFVRLGSTYAGAGLGLPIARWIAEAHGGTLVLESSGASGSVFTVTLPLPPDDRT